MTIKFNGESFAFANAKAFILPTVLGKKRIYDAFQTAPTFKTRPEAEAEWLRLAKGWKAWKDEQIKEIESDMCAVHASERDITEFKSGLMLDVRRWTQMLFAPRAAEAFIASPTLENFNRWTQTYDYASHGMQATEYALPALPVLYTLNNGCYGFRPKTEPDEARLESHLKTMKAGLVWLENFKAVLNEGGIPYTVQGRGINDSDTAGAIYIGYDEVLRVQVPIWARPGADFVARCEARIKEIFKIKNTQKDV